MVKLSPIRTLKKRKTDMMSYLTKTECADSPKDYNSNRKIDEFLCGYTVHIFLFIHLST